MLLELRVAQFAEIKRFVLGVVNLEALAVKLRAISHLLVTRLVEAARLLTESPLMRFDHLMASLGVGCGVFWIGIARYGVAQNVV